MKNIELIMDCGFTLYEAKILLEVVSHGRTNATQIAMNTGVPKNKVYEILENFLERRIITSFLSKPKQYSVKNLRGILKKNLQYKKRELKKIEGDVNKFIRTLPMRKESEKDFQIMEGKTAMVEKIVKTLDKVDKESIGFIDVWTARPENLKAIKQAIARGVKFYFLGEVNKKTISMIRKYQQLGVQIKNYPIEGAGYSILDKKYVQLRVTEEKLISLWIENSYLAGILRQHFWGIWRKIR